MSPALVALGVDKLTVPQRIALAQEILDSVLEEQALPPLSEAKRDELKRRLAAHEIDPTDNHPVGTDRGRGPGEIPTVSLPVVFRRVARREFDEAADWYERRQSGRGRHFAASVRRTLDRIADQPKLYAEVFEDVREAPVAGYPYCIY